MLRGALDTALLLAGRICEGQAANLSRFTQCVLVQPVQLRVLVSVGLQSAGRRNAYKFYPLGTVLCWERHARLRAGWP